MHISKYFELLRFYITEKIEEVNKTMQTTFSDEIRDVSANLLSAIFSCFLSQEFIDINGIPGVVIRIIVTIASYFILKRIFGYCLKYSRSKTKIDNALSGNLTTSDAKKFISKFDHIACDGVILAGDYLKKVKSIPDNKKHERDFYLIESIYYLKKSLCYTKLITEYPNICMNNANNSIGISFHRLKNIYSLANDIYEEILKTIDSLFSQPSNDNFGFDAEVKDISRYLESISSYIDNQNKNNTNNVVSIDRQSKPESCKE